MLSVWNGWHHDFLRMDARLTKKNVMTVFGHHGYGALGPSSSQSTLFRAIIQRTDGTVESLMNSDITEKFGGEGCASAAQQARYSAAAQSGSHCSLGIQIILVQQT